MEQLIPVKVKDGVQQLVSARDLHKALGSKKKFNAWWNQIEENFEEGIDYTREPKSYLVQSGNGTTRLYNDFLLTLDTAKQLCMMSHTDKGKQIRKYFIEVEKKWNDPQEVVKRGYAILQNENAQLKLENKTLTAQLEESNKKANYLDVILSTTDAIAVSQIANDYGMSAKKFNQLLHEVKIQRKVNGQWILYKAYMKDGKKYTVPHTFDYTDKQGRPHTKISTYWTQAGRRLIYDVLKDVKGLLPIIER